MQRRSKDDEAARSRLFGKRVALTLCGVVSVWFVVASVAQIVPAVFGAEIVPLASATESPDRACAVALRRAGGLGPSGAAADGWAGDREGSDLAPCAETSAGLDALAALRRLRMANEQVGRRDPASLDALRRELSAHLPAEMR